MQDDFSIYHICTHADWQAGPAEDAYRGTALDRRDGFIHFSTGAQLADTLTRYFEGRDDLIVLEVPLVSVASSIRWEALPGRPAFPHLYAALRRGDVGAIHTLGAAQDGRHALAFLEAGENP